MTQNSTSDSTESKSQTGAIGRTGGTRLTKSDRLIKLLRSRSGSDIVTLSTKLGWQAHSTRAALSRLRKAGHMIEKLPSRKQGAGARYRIASQ